MRLRAAFVIVLALTERVAAQTPAFPPPPWAYGFATAPGVQAPPAAGAPQRGRGAAAGPDTARRSVPGSTLTFTAAQVRGSSPADWFPGDHPTMPPIVAQGRADAQIVACSLCHYPNGKGRPENAGVSGLSPAYFMQTMLDFKNDKRKSFDTRKANTARMNAFAKAMTQEELEAAANYFAAIAWKEPWIRVVEADVVPKTRIAGGMFVALEGADAGTEPIAARIIEVPENGEQTETLRNPRSGFVAYVPKGSLARGQQVAQRGACALCHGPQLQGLGPVPTIAGRSPSYMVRQMYDMQNGARTGLWSELMKQVVGPMAADDMLAVSAYVASLKPSR